jgi:hypothetical protein
MDGVAMVGGSSTFRITYSAQTMEQGGVKYQTAVAVTATAAWVSALASFDGEATIGCSAGVWGSAMATAGCGATIGCSAGVDAKGSATLTGSPTFFGSSTGFASSPFLPDTFPTTFFAAPVRLTILSNCLPLVENSLLAGSPQIRTSTKVDLCCFLGLSMHARVRG